MAIIDGLDRCRDGEAALLDASYRYEATALSVFWPESQYHALPARPVAIPRRGRGCDLGRAPATHKFPGTGRSPVFEAALGGGEPDEDDLRAYPDVRHAQASMTMWTPARSSPCRESG